jgi:hypothetical protein
VESLVSGYGLESDLLDHVWTNRSSVCMWPNRYEDDLINMQMMLVDLEIGDSSVQNYSV